MAQPDAFLVQNGQTLLFQGDSLTDTGRRGEHHPYGWGYTRMVIDLVTARYPERHITYYNRGIGGNTTEDLLRRWYDDCVALAPDWVSILIGINDLGRRFGPDPENPIPPDAYRRNYETILTRTRDETGAGLILMDPYFISAETDPQTHRGTVRQILGDYVAVVREMADRFDAVHVPLQDLFQKQLEHRPADRFCPEPVHPNVAGHMVIAHAWLAAVGW